jgi:hypothetical protein
MVVRVVEHQWEGGGMLPGEDQMLKWTRQSISVVSGRSEVCVDAVCRIQDRA